MSGWAVCVSHICSVKLFFSQVRHPVDQFVSQYYYKMHGHRLPELLEAARAENMAETSMSRPASVNEWLVSVTPPGAKGKQCRPDLNILTRFVLEFWSKPLADMLFGFL